MEKDTERALNTLLKNTPLALIVVGIVVCIIAAAGGWPYPQLKIEELVWRIPLAIIGVFVAGIGVLLLLRKPHDEFDPKKYNFKITHPEHKGKIEVKGEHYEIRGSYAKKPPQDYSVEIIEYDPGQNNNYRPRRRVVVDDDNTWRAPQVWGGDKEVERTIAVALVGPSGRALFDYFERVGKVYNYQGRPGIDRLTKDVHICHHIRAEVKVT